MKSVSRFVHRTHGIVVRPGHSCCCPNCGERGFWVNEEDTFGRCGFFGCKFRIGFGLPPKVKAVEPEGESPLAKFMREQSNGKQS